MATSNLFKKAAILPTKKAGAAKAVKDEIEIVGLEELAQLDVLAKTLDSIRTTMNAEIKSQVSDIFLDKGQKAAKRPDNFKGVDGDAVVSCEFRKRSTASGLTDEQVKMLTDLGIKTEKTVAVPALFAINPKYSTDDKMLEKVSKAIARLVPDDFIVEQAEVSKNTVSEDTLTGIFALGDKMTLTHLETAGIIALKPTLSKIDLPAIFAKLQAIITPEFVDAALKEAEAKTTKAKA